MTSPENAVLRPVALSVLTRRAGSGADAAAVASTAGRAYEDLAGVLVPLIGQVGFDAVTTRALHLAQREYPSAPAGGTEQAGAFTQVSFWLKQQDGALAMDAAATMLSTLGALLVTFIGEPLTMRLLRKGWPDGFPEVKLEEKPT
ncbi:MAG TPA: hypothetical protein VHL58_12050 [Thermoanaerobaculia bacterium]|nr:hypothetical protein [Thermoanaerobaculia bacterium]